jgi:hypothetical protein
VVQAAAKAQSAAERAREKAIRESERLVAREQWLPRIRAREQAEQQLLPARCRKTPLEIKAPLVAAAVRAGTIEPDYKRARRTKEE